MNGTAIIPVVRPCSDSNISQVQSFYAVRRDDNTIAGYDHCAAEEFHIAPPQHRTNMGGDGLDLLSATLLSKFWERAEIFWYFEAGNCLQFD